MEQTVQRIAADLHICPGTQLLTAVAPDTFGEIDLRPALFIQSNRLRRTGAYTGAAAIATSVREHGPGAQCLRQAVHHVHPAAPLCAHGDVEIM